MHARQTLRPKQSDCTHLRPHAELRRSISGPSSSQTSASLFVIAPASFLIISSPVSAQENAPPSYVFLERQQIERVIISDFTSKVRNLPNDELGHMLENLLLSRTASAPELLDQVTSVPADSASKSASAKRPALPRDPVSESLAEATFPWSTPKSSVQISKGDSLSQKTSKSIASTRLDIDSAAPTEGDEEDNDTVLATKLSTATRIKPDAQVVTPPISQLRYPNPGGPSAVTQPGTPQPPTQLSGPSLALPLPTEADEEEVSISSGGAEDDVGDEEAVSGGAEADATRSLMQRLFPSGSFLPPGITEDASTSDDGRGFEQAALNSAPSEATIIQPENMDDSSTSSSMVGGMVGPLNLDKMKQGLQLPELSLPELSPPQLPSLPPFPSLSVPKLPDIGSSLQSITISTAILVSSLASTFEDLLQSFYLDDRVSIAVGFLAVGTIAAAALAATGSSEDEQVEEKMAPEGEAATAAAAAGDANDKKVQQSLTQLDQSLPSTATTKASSSGEQAPVLLAAAAAAAAALSGVDNDVSAEESSSSKIALKSRKPLLLDNGPPPLVTQSNGPPPLVTQSNQSPLFPGGNPTEVMPEEMDLASSSTQEMAGSAALGGSILWQRQPLSSSSSSSIKSVPSEPAEDSYTTQVPAALAPPYQGGAVLWQRQAATQPPPPLPLPPQASSPPPLPPTPPRVPPSPTQPIPPNPISSSLQETPLESFPNIIKQRWNSWLPTWAAPSPPTPPESRQRPSATTSTKNTTGIPIVDMPVGGNYTSSSPPQTFINYTSQTYRNSVDVWSRDNSSADVRSRDISSADVRSRDISSVGGALSWARSNASAESREDISPEMSTYRTSQQQEAALRWSVGGNLESASESGFSGRGRGVERVAHGSMPSDTSSAAAPMPFEQGLTASASPRVMRPGVQERTFSGPNGVPDPWISPVGWSTSLPSANSGRQQQAARVGVYDMSVVDSRSALSDEVSRNSMMGGETVEGSPFSLMNKEMRPTALAQPGDGGFVLREHGNKSYSANLVPSPWDEQPAGIGFGNSNQ
ncbi:hypothetical protein CEUSTIGMA_g2696.t1 [Chlamydomonas eustigma]|uniref:Uncharacterized protein n=1 Tax=Chlamydomonas eustigma TaxID=1157962 RepID=A0A250WWQ7_9CHLO|nr:hypothetical protein CEUSTIGMA_g2696.t1 [Chlamydomonas eustigma]|eukprot:GAX75251.1 hypothetical protein CEUSTIGMA_g2696.t1 [Chlamydomonas eustigma]